jgi:hypothetical protein
MTATVVQSEHWLYRRETGLAFSHVLEALHIEVSIHQLHIQEPTVKTRFRIRVRCTDVHLPLFQ